jgi:hypothetical protein
MMKKFIRVLFVLLVTGSVSANEIQSPLSVVNQRMDAYNQHDLKRFLALYDEGVEVYTYPDKRLAEGKGHLKSIFEPMLKEGKVKVKIHHQIQKDSYVINQETVTYGTTETEYVSVYKVENGLITEVRFIRD